MAAAPSPFEEGSASYSQRNLALSAARLADTKDLDSEHAALPDRSGEDPAWRGELSERLRSYRARRRKLAPRAAQSQLPFEAPPEALTPECSVVIDERVPAEDDFAFTIAIGRQSPSPAEDTRMVIDVSLPPADEPGSRERPAAGVEFATPGFFPVASIAERRFAAIVDAACLLFAYGGFLALFSSLGGQFTLSKLTVAVYMAAFAIVYLQYFALFTIFGGTTPGMMLRGLQVVTISGEPPAPRQMLLRAAGYMLSAGTFFLGFLWALWDEDSLTWHDRLSRTYLCPVPTFADIDASPATHSR